MIQLDHPWRADGQRQAFRSVLDAMARPGTVHDIAEWSGGGRVLTTVLAVLCDAGTSLHDRDGLLSDGDRSRLGAVGATAEAAAFVVVDGTQEPGDWTPALGTLLTPERGATVVMDCRGVGEGTALRLRGPGIAEHQDLRLSGIDPRWWTARSRWCAHPLGIDLIICDARRIACIPRSAAVEG